MAFDCNNQRKPLLFSDLFKTRRNEKIQPNISIPKPEGSSCSSSLTQFSSSCDSSSSGLSTPLCSELGSSESEDGDFIAELSRQMAECMLQDDEENGVADEDSEASHADSGGSNNGFCSSQLSGDDRISPRIQLKNQPPVSKEIPFNPERRVKGTESTQPKQIQKTKQHHTPYRGRNGFSGSGMQAVFLGGCGSSSGSPGTGVFLPRGPTDLKKKSGCTMVLMPTRVLQTLELHFSRRQDSTVPPLTVGSPKDESTMSDELQNEGSEVENWQGDDDEMQLPQEWTY